MIDIEVLGRPIAGSYQRLAPMTATGLTPPAGAKVAVLSVGTAAVFYRDDGVAPTSGAGVTLPVGMVFGYASNFSLIQFISATGTVDVAYYGN
jgi:hypothetical protein